MKYDQTQYDLVKIDGIPNVVVTRKKGLVVVPTIHSEIAPLIRPLAARNTDWTFLGGEITSSYITAGHRFEVYDGEEKLGEIWREWGRDGYAYHFSNNRIQKKRQRGGSQFTKDRNKAIKLIEKAFFRKTDAEVYAEKSEQIFAESTRLLTNQKWRYTHEVNSLSPVLAKFALQRWEEAGPILTAADPKAAELPELYEKFVTADTMHQAASKGCFRVVVRDGKYLIGKDMANFVTLEQEQLSPWLKRSLGMLQLVEDEAIVPGVGCRRADKEYLVLDRSDEDKEE